MISCTVGWDADAEDELARIGMQAPDPSAVTRAQAQADHLLATDPIGKGRYLAEGLYRLDVPPLTLNYAVALPR